MEKDSTLNQNFEDDAESKDFMEVFMDNKSDILHTDFLGKKRQLASAINGKGEEFESIRQKSKALEMINMIISSNKTLLKSEDLYHGDDLKRIFSQAKNNKELFENISKK